MRMFLKCCQKLIFLISLSVVISYLRSPLLAATSDYIEAKVKIGVCGNDLAEDNEDCDNLDLKSQTCVTLDYLSGDLSCNADCTYNKSLCIPKPVIVEEEEEDDDDDDDDDNSSRSSNSQSDNVPNPIETIVERMIIQRLLPQKITFFDLDNNDQLDIIEAVKILNQLASYFREEIESVSTCDLNGDNICNIVDFSILLYYVNR